MSADPLRIGICGNGTVGGGTIDILRDNAALLAARAGRPLLLQRVGARRDREDCPVGDVPVHRDLLEVARADDVDVVVECIGGTSLAAELTETALANGKSVVTANKALIAEQGNALLRRAEDAGASLLFEAAVAGGIPILKALREGMAANRIHSVAGIINGTGNFILTEMAAAGRDFASVLEEAQRLGYAEADPTFDVEGIDAAHKLTILAAMAFGTPLDFAAVSCEGISNVTADDLRFANELGYRVKHLGIAKRSEDGIELRVHPTLIPGEALLGNVDGVLNAVLLEGDGIGPTTYSGAGAGRLPTASAIVADLVDIARAGGQMILPMGVSQQALQTLPILPRGDERSAWYLRITAEDRPGVMSQLSSCLGAEGISIEVLNQKAPQRGESTVSIVALTNVARREALLSAAQAIGALDAVHEAPHIMRCESFAQE